MSSLPLPGAEAQKHSDQLCDRLHQDITLQGGWIPFSRFMELALYAPGLGYYSAGASKLGKAGDFVTAPEISPLFGRTVARQLAEIMSRSTPHILELGAGSGKLALDILTELDNLQQLPVSYSILEVSADLRERQKALLVHKLPHLIERVHWLDTLPDVISGAVVANEVLDALPVHVLRWSEDQVFERGVTSHQKQFVWSEKLATTASLLELSQQISVPDQYLSEISLAARGLVSSLSERLDKGALLFIDYGFGSSEYYHPQRNTGTLMCHYRHQAHDNPFFLPGLQDITSHVDFTAVAESGIDHGCNLLGYTTQAHFLINGGITNLIADISPDNPLEYLPLSAQIQKLTSPAEMVELFKVIALGKGITPPLSHFISGDKSRLL
jgi:SAM-dependent MidA family methyltransferase